MLPILAAIDLTYYKDIILEKLELRNHDCEGANLGP
jgi:hypothetical protein